jgi:hypothetical protein
MLATVGAAGRWRVIVGDNDGQRRLIDPEDGVNRYDAQWVNNDTVVVVSERGGIPNLELIDVAAHTARTLTRVTGAAVGADVNRRDGSIWFLSLHSLGFDVRRFARESAPADSAVPILETRFGWAGLRNATQVELPTAAVPPSHTYGSGPRLNRWLPGGYASAEGAGAFLTIFSGDIVGRLNATATGAFGERGTWRGGSLRTAWRFHRPTVEIGALAVSHDPSLARDAQPGADSLDASLFQGVLALAGERRGEGWNARARLGGAAGRMSPRLGESHLRGLAFAEGAVFLQQSRGARGYTERLRVHFSHGSNRTEFQRAIASVDVATIGRDFLPLQLGVTAGRVTGRPHPFEELTIGGVSSPVGDSSVLSQRFSMPMFPTGIGRGRALVAWRAALPMSFWTPFYEGASVGDDLDHLTKWNRAVGLERRYTFGPMPAAFIPRVQLRGGAAYTLDEPFRKRVRGFFEMRVEP